MHKLIQDAIVSGFIVLNILGVAQCAKAEDVGAEYVPHALCISPYVVAHDRAVMARAAHARGFDVIVGHSEGCAVTFMVGDADYIGVSWFTYDETRKLHRGRANDLLLAWEARLTSEVK